MLPSDFASSSRLNSPAATMVPQCLARRLGAAATGAARADTLVVGADGEAAVSSLPHGLRLAIRGIIAARSGNRILCTP